MEKTIDLEKAREYENTLARLEDTFGDWFKGKMDIPQGILHLAKLMLHPYHRGQGLHRTFRAGLHRLPGQVHHHVVGDACRQRIHRQNAAGHLPGALFFEHRVGHGTAAAHGLHLSKKNV